MKKSSLLLSIFALAFVFGLMHVISTRFYLFWTTWWADKLMHLAGGVVLAMFVIWLVYSFGEAVAQDKKKLFGIAFLCVMLIMVVWKVLERKFGIADSTQGYSLDFFLDFLASAIGACLGWLYAASDRFRLHD
jgi:hypothetical protein